MHDAAGDLKLCRSDQKLTFAGHAFCSQNKPTSFFFSLQRNKTNFIHHAFPFSSLFFTYTILLPVDCAES